MIDPAEFPAPASTAAPFAAPLDAMSPHVRRIAVSVVFFVVGVLLATWVSRIPAVQQQLRLTTGQLGGALLGVGVGAVAGMPLAGWVGARFGSRAATLVGLAIMSCSLPLAAAMPSAPTLACALFLLGFGCGAADVSMNVQAVSVEHRHGRSIMSSFHAFFSVGAMAGAALGGLCAGPRLHLAPETHLAAAALVFGAVGIAAAWLGMLPAGLERHPAEAAISNLEPSHAGSYRFKLPSVPILALAAIAFSSMLGEGAMGDWGALYLHKSLRASQQIAADGYALFAGAMAATRFVGDALTRRFGPAILARALGLLTTLGLALAIASHAAPLALIGYALAGIGFAVIVPLVFSATGRMPGGQASVNIGVISAIGYSGLLLGPPVIGFLAELVHLRWALCLVAALGLVIAALARFVQE